MKYRFEGCDACISKGCSWCDSDAICISSGRAIPTTPFIGCTGVIDTCASLSESNYFSNPLYGAANWIFDMINVKPVWDSGISKFFSSWLKVSRLGSGKLSKLTHSFPMLVWYICCNYRTIN